MKQRKCGTCIGKGTVEVEVHKLQGGGTRREACAVCNGTGKLPVNGRKLEEQPPEQRQIDVRMDLDHTVRIARFTVQEGLLLPVEVNIPFAAIKLAAGNIVAAEAQREISGPGRPS